MVHLDFKFDFNVLRCTFSPSVLTTSFFPLSRVLYYDISRRFVQRLRHFDIKLSVRTVDISVCKAMQLKDSYNQVQVILLLGLIVIK